MSGKQVNNAGTNSQGNNYKSYTDGSYSYSNKAPSGQTASNYYDTGKGHTFYKETSHSTSHAAQQGQPSQWHDNHNQGYRTYPSNSKK